MSSTYFKQANAFIEGNLGLLHQQRMAHRKLKESFANNPETHKLLVLPTGTGKTGVIGISPFEIADGRVLVITPNLIIREGISDEFDTRTPFNFWQKRNVIINDDNLPNVYRYAGFATPSDKKRVLKILDQTDIVIANIHKVSHEKSRKTLIDILPPDFFDMIIIDEAHHAAADSWQKTLNHFIAKKVIKLTATPFRGDQKSIEGEMIYEYPLAEAIKVGAIKNIVSEDFTTEKLEFLVDGKLVDKETALSIMDKNWLTRSVAYSEKCSRTIVEMSAKKLEEKRRHGKAHHQIIAVACSIDHAKQITRLYDGFGLKAAYVSSDEPDMSENVIIDFKKGQYDVIVNVNMLGEGFDHPNISIAAIFRPFRTVTPYAQFIGRSLRKIRENANDEIDNIAHVIYHTELDLDELWEYYTKQKEKARRRRIIFEEPADFERTRDVGEVNAEGSIIGSVKTFLSDGIASTYAEAIKESIDEFEYETNSNAEKMRLAGIADSHIEEYIKGRKRSLEEHIDSKRNKLRDELIREELHKVHTQDIVDQVESLFEHTRLEPDGDELPRNTSSAFLRNSKTNAGYAVKYINSNLKIKLKRGIDEWETFDFESARKLLPDLVQAIHDKIKNLEGVK